MVCRALFTPASSKPKDPNVNSAYNVVLCWASQSVDTHSTVSLKALDFIKEIYEVSIWLNLLHLLCVQYMFTYTYTMFQRKNGNDDDDDDGGSGSGSGVDDNNKSLWKQIKLLLHVICCLYQELVDGGLLDQLSPRTKDLVPVLTQILKPPTEIDGAVLKQKCAQTNKALEVLSDILKNNVQLCNLHISFRASVVS